MLNNTIDIKTRDIYKQVVLSITDLTTAAVYSCVKTNIMKIIAFEDLLKQENLPANGVKYVLVSTKGLPASFSHGPAWKPLDKDYEKFQGKLPAADDLAMVIKIKPHKVKFIDVINRRTTSSRYSYTTAVQHLSDEIFR